MNSAISKSGSRACSASILHQAGIRKMIARLHEELAHYEGSQEVQSAK